MQVPDGDKYSRQEAPRPDDDYAMWCKTKKGVQKLLLPADGIIVARSPYGGIGTPRFKDN